MPSSEIRQERFIAMEFRAQQGRRMTGRLLSYGREYNVDRFTETYRPGCFRKSISEAARRLPLMVEHGIDKVPVGVSVDWQDDDKALLATFEFDDRDEAREAARQAQSGILGGLSVGFLPIQTVWTQRPNGRPHADRKEARILETSLCALPVMEDAGVLSVRSRLVLSESRTPHLDQARDWLASIKRS